ncbi:hypothetical protein CEXT_327921 [Caerostris extrusa]|uniref:Secreted protein n=1 Tax=Caerostris extrusa TaxID=172846 RepID=A0AAV4VC82_CAEEX|nr:hypothetical protein CEXT_327921 [Caerostris extrusa]
MLEKCQKLLNCIHLLMFLFKTHTNAPQTAAVSTRGGNSPTGVGTNFSENKSASQRVGNLLKAWSFWPFKLRYHLVRYKITTSQKFRKMGRPQQPF